MAKKYPHGDIKWFKEARFGMFIHWGLYSLPARHEWIRHYEEITDENYQIYFDMFNPDLFEPAKVWVTEAYGFLSSFVHNDSLNIMFYTKPSFNEEGISPCSMWGQHVTRKGEIFSRLVEVIAPCDLLFFSMLKDPKIDISMKTLLVKEKDFPNTMNMYWVLDGLRKVCMLLLVEHDSHDKIKHELTSADCPFYEEKKEDSL